MLKERFLDSRYEIFCQAIKLKDRHTTVKSVNRAVDDAGAGGFFLSPVDVTDAEVTVLCGNLSLSILFNSHFKGVSPVCIVNT